MTPTIEICENITELHRKRQDLHRAEKSLTLQIKAQCRRMLDGDKKEADKLYRALMGKADHELTANVLATAHSFMQARELIEEERKSTEKAMEKLAKTLPVAEWVKNTRGFGFGSLAAIVGETTTKQGILPQYNNPAKVWKRMGLAVIHGKRQQRVAGAEAMKMGYSPIRRSIMWNIGDAIIRAGGPYRELYDERKEYEIAKQAAKGVEVLPAAQIPKDGEGYMSQGHIHNRSKRWMEKRLLRDLWREWRQVAGVDLDKAA